jgi:hypothetical protein
LVMVALSFLDTGLRMQPLALAESGWVWVGAASWPAGLQTGRPPKPLVRRSLFCAADSEGGCAGCDPAGP